MGKFFVRDMILEAWARSGLTAAELSERSGVSYNVITKLKLRGESSTAAENAVLLANSLGVSLQAPIPEDGPRHAHEAVLDIATKLAVEIAAEAPDFPYDPSEFAQAFRDLMDYRLKQADLGRTQTASDNVVDFRIRILGRKAP